MALSGSTIWEVETTGSDTLNGGAFDPSQTAGMFTDGAATLANTTAPSFTSASYTFLSGDINAWLYIASGTNWTAGWYKITNVISGAAILAGTIGQGVLKTTLVPTTVVGCATVASPTAATWTIDYSQQASAQFTYTDLASAGTGLTVSSALKPFAKQQVGNSIVITGGTNFNTGRYVIASISGTTATVVGPTNITTGAGANGTGGMGGALASPGQAGAVVTIASMITSIKSGTYSVTSASTNVSGGCFSSSAAGKWTFGYGTIRGDMANAPLIQASGISSFTLFTSSGTSDVVANLIFDGASLTSSRGFSASSCFCYALTGRNCTNSAFITSAASEYVRCTATGCSTQPAFTTGGAGASYFLCEAFSNTISGFNSGNSICTYTLCLSYNNTGASSDGFAGSQSYGAICCTAYANGRDGFRVSSNNTFVVNCISENNTGWGINVVGTVNFVLTNNATFNNTAGGVGAAVRAGYVFPNVACTAEIFVNAAGNNFALNATPGGGNLCRAAGIPGAFPAAATTGFQDIGAVQSRNLAARWDMTGGMG